MSELRVAEVDAQNRFVRWVSRATCHAERLPHRSVQVLLYDTAGRLVLQRRHPLKRTWADAWDVSASGHVEEPDYPDPARPDDDLDAIYDAVASRELEEELGVTAPLERLGAFGPEPGVHYEHFVLYRGVHDGPYVAQPEEVAEVRVFDPPALAAFLASDARRTRSLEWILDHLGG
ncbi:MAG: NUDIX domain-containing protein [Myxococcales bacterium]|nr:NUDIX domain-containing protein [Myxococcales bacterium]MCB9596676.1 NUDIX domain-containing protein [Sandaracinaceae bacterium]